MKSINQIKTKISNMTNKSFSTTQVVRHLFQIAGFLLLPGLFLLTLGSFKGIWQAILGGNWTWTAMGAPLLTLLAVLPITALWGRFFCGYLCAFGGMQELLDFIAKKCKLSRLTVPLTVDRVLRNMKYVVLGGLVLLWTLGISYDAVSPWQVFGQYASVSGWTDLGGWLTVGGLLLLGIAAVSLFVERAFCRYLCPLGGIFSLISHWRLFRVKKNSQCVNCGRCDTVCPMGIDVNRDADSGGSVRFSECIDCFRCVDHCGVKALYTAPREAVAGSAAALAVAGLYQVGTITVKLPLGAVTDNTSLSQGQYVDGTYEGSAQGYRGTITVQVKVSGGMISSITVENYRDDEQFFSRAKDTIINAILAGQTTDVAAVSGATYSSRGIMQAVANALGVTPSQSSSDELPQLPHENNSGEEKHQRGYRQGETNGSSNSDNRVPSDNQSSATQNTTLDFSNLTDGTYNGTGQGRNGDITVSVKVQGGKVTSITVESSREDAQYFNRAKDTVIGEILDSQSLNVATVSGATMSSNGLIDAVANALGISYTNPNAQQGARGSHQGRGRNH